MPRVAGRTAWVTAIKYVTERRASRIRSTAAAMPRRASRVKRPSAPAWAKCGQRRVSALPAEEARRILRDAFDVDLEMQVRARGATGRSDACDLLPRADDIAGANF